jgi:hypothetical protein
MLSICVCLFICLRQVCWQHKTFSDNIQRCWNVDVNVPSNTDDFAARLTSSPFYYILYIWLCIHVYKGWAKTDPGLAPRPSTSVVFLYFRLAICPQSDVFLYFRLAICPQSVVFLYFRLAICPQSVVFLYFRLAICSQSVDVPSGYIATRWASTCCWSSLPCSAATG